MNPRKAKALNELLRQCKEHIGHTITADRSERREYLVKDAVIVNDTVMLKVNTEAFPTIYFDAVIHCSCQNDRFQDENP